MKACTTARLRHTLAIALFACAAVPAVQAENDAAPATETIVLKAAHLFDSTGTLLKDGALVVVRGDRIISVGSGDAPTGARVIDLGDATLLPGFIDSHTHLTFEFDKDFNRYMYNSL
jgi:imidazolonepropionase-like amidohydrolase